MQNIQITCDRCGKIVNGTIDTCPSMGTIITDGYYLVAEGKWKKFQREDEKYICDDCMYIDPKYKNLAMHFMSIDDY